ncbi:MAG: biotin--[acetyl-CoA-carboxylase] ligase [Burkholderiales bacterium]|nr:biotin--[acetyl-CoA-carboxylase] ligase [Burkholderiales bacterium]
MPPLSFDLLRRLADARWHSGAQLAHEQGVTPAAMRAALRELEAELKEFGLELRTAPGRGYRLAEPYDCLDADAVRALLGGRADHFHLELLDACASTNTLLLERARAGAASGSAIACELQSAGRGRRGKDWQSGLGGSLTFSLLWRYENGAAGLSGLSLAVGVAMARALASLDVAGVQLKWPNDLLHAGRKLGGILIEVQGNAAVIGIGLNLRLRAGVRDVIAQPVTELASIAAHLPQRNRLLAAALIQLEQVLTPFADTGFAPLRDEWMACHAHQGGQVTLFSGDGRSIAGVAVGVAEDGALLLETARGTERFVNGEVSLRARQPGTGTTGAGI